MHPDDCWGLRRGRTYTFGEHEIDFPCAHLGSSVPANYCCIPILAHGETIGLLHLEFGCGHQAGHAPSCKDPISEQRRLGLVCAEQISLAIANVKLRDQLRDQSIRDVLTGLFNRTICWRPPGVFASSPGGAECRHPVHRCRSFQEIQRQSRARRGRHGLARCWRLSQDEFPRRGYSLPIWR